MTTLSTHDTKRSEDVRARLSVIAEIPQEWSDAVLELIAEAGEVDGPTAHLLIQAAVGAWPISQDRMTAYATKAIREAGQYTTWTDPDEGYEAAVSSFVGRMFGDLEERVSALAARLTDPGRVNSLSQKVLQLTGPGFPDVYQGTEVWDHSLVDPDNRRPVNHLTQHMTLTAVDSGLLPPIDDSGAAKLLVVSRALRLRRERPDLFGRYFPLAADGPAAEHLVAVDRGGAIAAVTRLPVGLEARGGWGDTWLDLPPGVWADVFTGRTLGEDLLVADLFADYPVALLTRTAEQ